MFIKFHENPGPEIASFISKAFTDRFEAEYKFGPNFENQILKDGLEFIGNYDPHIDGLWTLENMDGIKGSILIDGHMLDQDQKARLRLFILTPDTRGQGWGAKLLEQSIEFARSKGFKGIYLWTLEDLEPVGSLYRKRGFTSAQQVWGTQWGNRVREEMLQLQF